MHIFVRGGTLLLVLGDLVAFFGALILTLLVRYREIPTQEILRDHLNPFSILFILWTLIFLITGLYDRHISLVRKRIPVFILKVQFFNVLSAALMFFIFPFGIEPKTNLAIYLVISTACVVVCWVCLVYLALYYYDGFARFYHDAMCVMRDACE